MLEGAQRERRNMDVRDKKESKGHCPEFGGLERNVQGGGILMSLPGWFHCSHM